MCISPGKYSVQKAANVALTVPLYWDYWSDARQNNYNITHSNHTLDCTAIVNKHSQETADCCHAGIVGSIVSMSNVHMDRRWQEEKG